MPYIRSADGITTDFGGDLTQYVGPGSAVYSGAPLSQQFMGNIPFGSPYVGPGTNILVITGGTQNGIIATGIVGGATPGFKWFKYYLMN